MIKLFYLTNKYKLSISYFVTVMSFIPHMAATFFINSQINIFKETHLPSFTSEKVFFVSPTTLSRNQRRQQHIPVSCACILELVKVLFFTLCII